MDVLVGQLLIRGPWNSAIYSKGASTPDLPGERRLAFWKGSSVQVPVMSCSFSSVEKGSETFFLVQLEVKVSLLCACLGCMTCGFGLLSPKSNSAPC